MLVKIVDQASYANYQLETFVKEKIDLVLRVSDWYNAIVKQLANDSIFEWTIIHDKTDMVTKGVIIGGLLWLVNWNFKN